jgi:hypothetical protein
MVEAKLQAIKEMEKNGLNTIKTLLIKENPSAKQQNY